MFRVYTRGITTTCFNVISEENAIMCLSELLNLKSGYLDIIVSQPVHFPCKLRLLFSIERNINGFNQQNSWKGANYSRFESVYFASFKQVLARKTSF